MAINTRRVTGRRQLSFETTEDLQNEAERLASADVEMLGNWSLGQVLRHLSIAINGSIDGFAFRLTWPEVLFVRLLMKKRLLAEGIRPGHGSSRRWDGEVRK